MSETSQEEMLHTYLTDEAKEKMEVVEYDLKNLREECECIYVETGSMRARKIAMILASLEENDAKNI